LLTGAGRFERIGTHIHVGGLGFTNNLKAIEVKGGMVSQEKAREAAGLVLRMIKDDELRTSCALVLEVRHEINS
jgi:TBP-interacting protein